MKKVITILLILIYVIPVSGITLQLHYCGGNYSSLKFILADTTASCACGSKTMKKKGCCKNKTVYLNIKEDQKPSAHFIISFDPTIQHIVKEFPFILNTPLVSYSLGTIDYHAPPPRHSHPLQVFNSTFLI